MIKLDGSEGEGGGQILRSALTLSALTGQPFEIKNIRAGRAKPGLLRQHLTALRAAAAISGGKYSDNVAIGATELMFYPGDVRASNYEFAVGTAGSAMLVLQTILLPLLQAEKPSRVIISGGTHNPSAPPYEFVAMCFLPVLARMGADVELKLLQYGFMPAGGGRIMAVVQPCDGLQPVHILERGPRLELYAEALFANLPFNIADRELAQVDERLSLGKTALKVREVESIGPGNMLSVHARFEQVSEMVSAFGRRGVRSEKVADDVADAAAAYLGSEGAVGLYLADQLLLPMAVAGGGSFTSTAPTPHTMTNVSTITKFLDVDIQFETINAGGDVKITVTRK
jgi:RNA 3'-terminal phosphate cyclase (ATP)